MRSLALALLLACGCTPAPTRQQVIACERASGWYTYRSNRSVPNGDRYVCVREVIPPVTPEANDAP